VNRRSGRSDALRRSAGFGDDRTRAIVGLPVLVLAALTLASVPVHAQLTGANLFEGQAGNYPKSYVGRGPANRQDFYDQANLSYTFSSGIVGLRFETNRNSEDEHPYQGISERFLDWSDGGYRVRVGNFYSILGRGLIQRAFELNGVILDQRFPRSRFGPSRDVDGVMAEATLGRVSATLLTGAPNGGESSLAGEQLGFARHSGQVSGAQIATTVYRGSRVGAAYLRMKAGLGQQELGTGFVDLDPLRLLEVESVSIPIYVEYAQANRSFGDWWSFATKDRVPHALYASTNLLAGPVTFSAEWKDYSQFRLGVNDPPSLVREHSQVLLNRTTHVLIADREEGFQLEGSYAPIEWVSLVTNWSRSDGANAKRFEERFIEVRSAPRHAERWEATAFYDRSWDQLISIADRRTTGIAATLRAMRRWSGTLDFERQTARRTTSGAPQLIEDIYLAGTVARADVGSASVIWTRTTDPLDLSRVVPGNKPLHLIGGVIDARLTSRHEAILFIGRRRGGLACTAGTCYEVQAFEGAELRVVSRF